MTENLSEKEEEVFLQLDDGKANDVPPSRDKVMMNVFTQMNENLNNISESLKRLHQSNSTAAGKAVPAKKAKPSPKDTLSESDDSDSEELLTDKADSGRKTDHHDESQDGLLEKIAQSLKKTKRTDKAVAKKLADTANKCWLQKLSDEKLKEKLENFLSQSTAIK